MGYPTRRPTTVSYWRSHGVSHWNPQLDAPRDIPWDYPWDHFTVVELEGEWRQRHRQRTGDVYYLVFLRDPMENIHGVYGIFRWIFHGSYEGHFKRAYEVP